MVDVEFKVYGIENLWVIDVFVMFCIVFGNINVLIIMIVEKGLDMIFL